MTSPAEKFAIVLSGNESVRPSSSSTGARSSSLPASCISSAVDLYTQKMSGSVSLCAAIESFCRCSATASPLTVTLMSGLASSKASTIAQVAGSADSTSGFCMDSVISVVPSA